MLKTSNNPHRVLMVTGVYPTAEIPHLGTFIRSQVESLVAAGLEVEVILPRPHIPDAFRYASAAAQVFLKTLTGQYDIVHGHGGLWCLAARLQWTTPVVASFLGDDLLGTPLWKSRWSKKAAFVVLVCRWLCKHVDAVIVKSEEMNRATPGKRAFVIPNGVDFELFHPIPRAEARKALGWKQDQYYVLFANNPHIPRKGFQLAQASIECLRSREIDAQLVVANGLPQVDVVQYINASNAIILSSIHEGSPNIVKEAMACNVPVVSTLVGDVPQIIGRTAGCRICASTPEDLAAGLEGALQHNEPTTGRADIAHLECSVVAKQVLVVYEYARSPNSWSMQSLSSSREHKEQEASTMLLNE